MAYIDKNKKKFIADRDENQFIGFKLPFELDNGGFNSLTTETLDAVKQNLLNLFASLWYIWKIGSPSGKNSKG